MKKTLTILAMSLIILTSTFAATKTGTITLNSTLEETNYKISLYYGDNENFTSSSLKTVDNLNITKDGHTDFINVVISSGNLNKSITYVTKISDKAFEGVVDGKTITVDNKLKVRDTTGNVKKTYTTTVKAGPNESQKIATFDFAWDAAENLPAGDYSTTNTITVSVD